MRAFSERKKTSRKDLEDGLGENLIIIMSPKIRLPKNERKNLESLIERLDEFGAGLPLTNPKYHSTKVRIVMSLWSYDSSGYGVSSYWCRVIKINQKHFERDMSPAAIELRRWFIEHPGDD